MRFLKKSILVVFLLAALCALLSIGALALDDQEITVCINDAPISFTDASTSARDGRVFVPFRAVFEALGAQVDYAADTQTVTAVRGDTTVSFVIGQCGMMIREGDNSRTFETDVASFAENSRVRVPVRFAAEAFGCNVGWDNNSRTVLILDTQAILAENDAQYTLMDRYMTYAQKYQSGSYAIAGSFHLSLDITEEGELIPITSDATITGLYNQNTMNLDLDMAMDLSELLAATGAELDEETMQLAALLQNIEIEYIVDLSDGMLYVRSPLLSAVTGITGDGVWYSMDLSNMLDGYEDLITVSNSADFVDYVRFFSEMMTIANADELDEATQFLRLINTSFCDDAFVQDGDTYTNTFAYADDYGAAQASMVLELGNDDSVVSFAFSAAISSNELSLDIVYSLDENGALIMTMDMNASEAFDMSLRYDLKYTETDELPVRAPEEGSTIIPMDSAMV